MSKLQALTLALLADGGRLVTYSPTKARRWLLHEANLWEPVYVDHNCVRALARKGYVELVPFNENPIAIEAELTESGHDYVIEREVEQNGRLQRALRVNAERDEAARFTAFMRRVVPSVFEDLP